MKCIWLERCFKSRIQWSTHGFPFTLRTNSLPAIYGSQNFDSHKWPTVLVDEVKGKPCNFKACLCGSLYSTFTKSVINAFQRPTRPIQGNVFLKGQNLRSKVDKKNICRYHKLNFILYCIVSFSFLWIALGEVYVGDPTYISTSIHIGWLWRIEAVWILCNSHRLIFKEFKTIGHFRNSKTKKSLQIYK